MSQSAIYRLFRWKHFYSNLFLVTCTRLLTGRFMARLVNASLPLILLAAWNTRWSILKTLCNFDNKGLVLVTLVAGWRLSSNSFDVKRLGVYEFIIRCLRSANKTETTAYLSQVIFDLQLFPWLARTLSLWFAHTHTHTHTHLSLIHI